jgi:(2S)-methylsuccinyl-CoA dehydrogenase
MSGIRSESSPMRRFSDSAGDAFAQALGRLRDETDRGTRIDAHQVRVRRVAACATRIEAARALGAFAEAYPDETVMPEARYFWAETLRAVSAMLDGEGIDAPSLRALLADPSVREAAVPAFVAKIGGTRISSGGVNHRSVPTASGDGSDERELRDGTRRFAQSVVAPLAEAIHREDRLIPEDLIRQMAELGYFGMSIPEEYGGVGMTNLMMILATEELSAASLPAAGSLITRPEILAKALLKGGTSDQKRTWLPRVASGECMVAVAVTEPNVGSDVASVTCRAEPDTVDGVEGFAISGAKAWCTFAGRANVLSLLARTEADPSLGHKGLSLFIVEKDPFTGHEFTMHQPSGGSMTGKADATLGYRGMHSFSVQFDRYFVPAVNLVGGPEGRGRGFYLQMDGFAAGRLQTGGRAAGLAQAALEAAARYANERSQFGKPLAAYQNTQFEIGHLAAEIEAARQLTYAAARAMDAHAANAPLLAAMAKRFACRVAVDVTQRAQVLHGGWGYAEEYPIARYVADALVLPIFEGVEPILDLKVIGRALLAEVSA